MSNSVLYASNNIEQTIAVGGTTINFGSAVRKFGCCLELSGGNPLIKNSGYYSVDANINLATTSAGDVTIQLYKDGMPLTGAKAVFTADTGTNYQVTIPTLIKQGCGCMEGIITAVISGVTGTITSSILVEKV